jgi:hypothetical protein
MNALYKVDSRNRTFGELWRIHCPDLFGFLVVAFCKLLRIPFSHGFGIRRPEQLNLHEPAALPPLVRDRFAKALWRDEDLGLDLQFYYSVDCMVGSSVKAYAAILLDTEGLFWVAALTVTKWDGGPARYVEFNCLSPCPTAGM